MDRGGCGPKGVLKGRPSDPSLSRVVSVWRERKDKNGRQRHDPQSRARRPRRIGFLTTFAASGARRLAGLRFRALRVNVEPLRASSAIRPQHGWSRRSCRLCRRRSGRISRQATETPRFSKSGSTRSISPRAAGARAKRVRAGYGHRKLPRSGPRGGIESKSLCGRSPPIIRARRPGARRTSLSRAGGGSGEGVRRLGSEGAWALAAGDFVRGGVFSLNF